MRASGHECTFFFYIPARSYRANMASITSGTRTFCLIYLFIQTIIFTSFMSIFFSRKRMFFLCLPFTVMMVTLINPLHERGTYLLYEIGCPELRIVQECTPIRNPTLIQKFIETIFCSNSYMVQAKILLRLLSLNLKQALLVADLAISKNHVGMC